MAEVVKKKDKNKHDIEKKEPNKSNEKKQKKQSNKGKSSEEKQNIITRIVTFFKGVKSEIKKVHWLDKKDMVKYSIATIVFIVFCAIFFYAIMNLFALVQELFK